MRYLAAAELHDGSQPGGTGKNQGEVHYHLLISEGSTRLSERGLRLSWYLGFARANLVREAEDAVGHVPGYVSKSVAVRVWASQDYGVGDARPLEPTVSSGIATQ